MVFKGFRKKPLLCGGMEILFMCTQEKREMILALREKRKRREQKKKRKFFASLTALTAAAAVTAGMVLTVSAKEVSITEIDEFSGTNETKTIYTIGNSSVGEILEKQDVVVNDTDKLNVDINSNIDDSSDIVITRGKEITIVANGVEQNAVVTKADAVDALVEAGHIPGESDEIKVDNGSDLKDSDKIELITVSDVQEVQNEDIENGVDYINDDTLDEGQTKVIDEGQTGRREIVSNVTYRSGEEASREIISDNVTVEARNKVIAVGTKKKAVPASANTGKTSTVDENGTINGMSYSKKITMTATAYSTSPSENGGYAVSALGNPLGYGIVAVDPSVIPLGSKVYVAAADGSWTYGVASAEDTGGAIKGNKIDLCYEGSVGEVNQFGRRSCVVYVLN